MSLLPYELLIRFDDAGNYKGGHTIRRDSVTGALSQAQPIGADKTFTWPAVAAEVNTASLAAIEEKDAEKAKLEADHAVAQSSLDAIESVLATASPEEAAARTAEVLAKAREGKQTATDKEIAALEAQIAEETARLAKLRAK